jgi:predicted transcriptional regulator
MEDLNELLKVLGNAGMTLQDFQKLANIASSNPGQFSMLLNMLRAQ